MRNLKTGLAVFLAIIAWYLGIIQTPIFAVSVCIFSIKNTVKGSLDNAISRILGTILGGVTGFLFALFFGGNTLLTPIGVILVIQVCKEFKIADSAAIASVTFASILLGVSDQNPFSYSVMRTVDTLVGVLIALVVNFWISRRNYLKYLCSEFNHSNSDCIALITHMVKRSEYYRYSDLEESFDTLKSYYTQLVDEIVYSNESGDLGNIKQSFDLCEQLLHHIHGLHLLERSSQDCDSINNNPMAVYYLSNVNRLLTEAKALEVNVESILERKTA